MAGASRNRLHNRGPARQTRPDGASSRLGGHAADNSRATSADLGLDWSWSHRLITALLFAIYIVLVAIWQGTAQVDEQLEEKSLMFVAPLLLWPAWWLLRMTVTIAKREQQSDERIALLRAYLRLRLSVELLDDGGPTEFARGNAKTEGVDVITTITGYDRIICAVVRNTSAKQATFVEARFATLGGDNGNRMRDPVPVHWLPIGSLTDSTTVPAQCERTLQLFRVTGEGVYFANPKVPLGYQHFFQGGTEFTGRLAVEELYHGSLEISFALDAGGEPKLRILGSNFAAHRSDEERERELTLMEASQA